MLTTALLVLLLSSPAAAQEPGPVEDIGLTATTGFGGRQATSGWTPLEVGIHPTRLVAGTLTVEVSGPAGLVREQRTIEVAAGSRKLYRFVVPSGPATVRVAEPGASDPASVRPRGTAGGDEFLAGVLGAVPADPAPLRHEPTGMGGVWVPVEPAWLELSHRSLDSLSLLVADPGALDSLGPQARVNLSAAVAGGLDLVVPAGPAGAAPGWLPGTGVDAGPGLELADAGRGRLAVTDLETGAALGDRELWAVLAGPRPGLGGHMDWAVEHNPWAFPRLLHEPGGAAPALPWLSVFILAYVLVVGPVNALVLSRFRRRELSWVTVPLVTAIFTAGAFLGAVGGRPPLGVAAQLTTWVDGAAVETVVAAARAPTAGEHRITVAGHGWSLQPVLPGGRPATVLPGGSDATIGFSLGALELGGLLATRASDEPAPLSVEAVEGADGLQVRVRNIGAAPLRQVTVHAATTSRRVGDIGPGETADTTFDGDALPAAADLHHRPNQAASPPRSLEALLGSDLRDGSPGLVWAVGETDAGPDTVRVGGQAPTGLGALVAVAARPDAGRPGPYSVARAAVAGRQDLYRPGPQAVEGPGPLFLRFRFPAAAAVGTLTSQLERGPQFGNPELAVWDRADGAWQPLGAAFPDDRGDPARLLSPAGEVWVRASGDLFPFEFSARTVTGVGS